MGLSAPASHTIMPSRNQRTASYTSIPPKDHKTQTVLSSRMKRDEDKSSELPARESLTVESGPRRQRTIDQLRRPGSVALLEYQPPPKPPTCCCGKIPTRRPSF